MATDFAPMQVGDTHIPWHAQIPVSTTESTTGAQNPWWSHGITLTVRDMPTEFASMQVDDNHIPWHTHRSPFQQMSRPWVLNSKSVVASRNHLNCPWYANGICSNANWCHSYSMAHTQIPVSATESSWSHRDPWNDHSLYIYIYIYMNEIHIDGMALYHCYRLCIHLEFNRPICCFEEIWWSPYIINKWINIYI